MLIDREIAPPKVHTTESWTFTRKLISLCKDDILDSSRLCIESSYHISKPRSILSKFIIIAGLLRLLIRTNRSKLPSFKDSAILVILPTNTKSSILNLAPIVKLLLERDREVILALPKNLEHIPNEFPNSIRTVKYSQFVNYIGFFTRLKLLKIALSKYLNYIKKAKLIENYGSNQLRKEKINFIGQIYLSSILLETNRTLFSNSNIECVLTTSDLLPFEHQLVTTARFFNIPSFLIQHGCLGVKHFPYFTDKIVVWGDSDKITLEQLGAETGSIAVAGMPASDRYSINQYSDEKHLNRNELIFVLVSNIRYRGPSMTSVHLKAFFEDIVLKYPNISWKIRLHPTEGTDFYRSLGEKIFSKLEFLPRDMSLEDSLDLADFVCTTISTSGLEAMMRKKPVLVFAADKWVKSVAWWPEYQGGLYISNANEFSEFLLRINSEADFVQKMIDQQNRFIHRRFKNFGESSKAIAELLVRN